MSKTVKEEKRDEKEGTLRTAVVEGRRVFYSDSRITPALAKRNKNRANTNPGKRKPRIVFA